MTTATPPADVGGSEPDPLAPPVTGLAETSSVTTERWGAFDVVRVTGDFDVSTCAPVRLAVDDLVIDQGRVHLVVDLSDLRFMDSSGLGALVRAHRQCRGLRGSLAVVCPEGPVLRVITLTGLHRVLRVHDTLAEALAPDPS